jgi:pimeloyl-ACP methyl ester carboxylesterase
VNFLLVHGLGLSSRIWSDLVPYLKGEIIAIDLPGHGDSSCYDFSWDGIYQTIVDSISKDEWMNTVLVLHSFSSCALPEIIQGGVRPKCILILEGPLISSPYSWTSRVANLDDTEYLKWLGKFKEAAEISLRVQLVSRHSREKLKYWSDGFKRVNPKALRVMAANLYRRIESNELPKTVRGHAKNIRYICGGRSCLNPGALEVAKTLQLSIDFVPNSKHFPMIDNPSILSLLIMQG